MAQQPSWVYDSSVLKFRDHTQTHHTR